MFLYMNVTVCKCRSEGAFLSAYGHNMCTAVCECECVRFNKHLNCFPIWLSSASDRTPNLIPQGHPLHTLFIFLLSLGYGNLFQPLSRPTTTIFLLPPTRLNFRNILNLLPIDFRVHTLIEDSEHQKGRYLQHQCGYIQILPHSH